ncbi:DUF485 domain-containing protein [Streptomyces sp. NPDC023998]|uniref:DUF485 domain-containing protein n=1 Tax=Streptomyces sp. NPDC023998 TaxID=3154597 RepID=UPI0033DB70DB
MSSHGPSPEHDSTIVAALYLSGLRHGSSYTPAELRQAIAQSYAGLHPSESLLPRYWAAQRAADAGDQNSRERRLWALRMAAVLAQDEQPTGRTPSQWAAGPASSPAAATASPSRRPDPAVQRLRAARRLPVRVTVTVLGVHMAIAVLARQAGDLLALPIAGPFNVGFGLLLVQLAVTAGAAVWYGPYAQATIDPLTEHVPSCLAHPESDR